MSPARRHVERHRTSRTGWLRAAVLGANDGIVSTASLIAGVAAAGAASSTVLMTGVAGLVAGAMSMAAGEYVSVSSQADSERSDLSRERRELAESPEAELRELTGIYVGRGVSQPVAEEVARQLTQHDALGAHARDELGLSGATAAQPLVAAGSSAASFTVGATLPLAVAWTTFGPHVVAWVTVTSVLFLAVLGAWAARAGGAPVRPAAWRVAVWGALAMGITAGVGKLFAVAV